ncbi:response regulator transcription factor [Streptomyces sp. NPDC093089]|uniref:response regulator transcription factor n=1 Tax=Streptomyces sp. NPDC093089 TaxID=3366024 RepID=UPI00382A72E1
MRVLLVEDDEPVTESLRRGLLRYGFEVEWVTTGTAGLAVTTPYGPVLLDLGLPDTDGPDVCRALRRRGDVPIIVISARSDETDRVVGLEIGADDYVSKPFGVREVIARIRAVMRRVRPAEQSSGPQRYGARLTVDRKAARVRLSRWPPGSARSWPDSSPSRCGNSTTWRAGSATATSPPGPPSRDRRRPGRSPAP